MRTDVSRQRHLVALQLSAGDAQRGETFVLYIFYLCAQTAQGFYQQSDGALAHALGAGQCAGAFRHAEIGGEEAHGSTCRSDVNVCGKAVESFCHDPCVVAFTQILNAGFALCQGVQHQYTVADAFRCRQPDGYVQSLWGRNNIAGSCIGHNYI